MPLTPTPTAESLKTLTISDIARLIRIYWENIYFGAKPYIQAMNCLETVDDNYGMDSGRTIINYALANMQSFSGPVARLVKAELRRRIK